MKRFASYFFVLLVLAFAGYTGCGGDGDGDGNPFENTQWMMTGDGYVAYLDIRTTDLDYWEYDIDNDCYCMENIQYSIDGDEITLTDSDSTFVITFVISGDQVTFTDSEGPETFVSTSFNSAMFMPDCAPGCFDDTEVIIETPSDGDTVTQSVVLVEGFVTDSSVTQAIMSVNGQGQPINVFDGFFSNQAVLSVGLNTIRVEVTIGQDVSSDEVDVFFDGDIPALRANLTWNTNFTDMDLYMMNPAGDICYYANQNVGGMVLDIDDTDGFGPENISVVTPMAGSYEVRVENFTGMSAWPTTVTVRVFQDEVLFDTQSHQYDDNDDLWIVGSYVLAGGKWVPTAPKMNSGWNFVKAPKQREFSK